MGVGMYWTLSGIKSRRRRRKPQGANPIIKDKKHVQSTIPME